MEQRKTNIALATALIGLGACAAADEPKQPNIIMIFADDLGYGDVECLNPQSKIKTPHLNSLAENGVLFTNAHSASSVSTPSRYGLLTGEYAWKSSLKAGVLYGFSAPLIDKDKPTIGNMLQKEGYHTACIGKWHLGVRWATTDGKVADGKGTNVDYTKPLTETPTSRGFDYFYGIAGSMDMPPYLPIENDKVAVQPSAFHQRTTFTRKDDEIGENPFLRSGAYIKGETPEVFLPRFTAKVKEKITEYASTSKPFFIYFPMTAPHAPIAPNKTFQGKSGIGRYGDFVMEVDDVVGQVVSHLKKEGIADNTIILFSSDNGPEYFAYSRLLDTEQRSAGEWKGIKRDLWEGGHRIPFIVSWAKELPKGKHIGETVSLCDIYATLADITKHERTAEEAEDSYSLLPLITAEGRYERPYTIHHSASGRFAIRKGNWVLIENGSGNDNGKNSRADYYKALGYTEEGAKPTGELFDLSKDPKQQTNVYAQHPQVVQELTALLDKATAGHKTKRDR